MATCAGCGTMILFGGVTEGGLRFCNAACQRKAGISAALEMIPQEVIEAALLQTHHGACPQCGGEGPVDVHHSHRVWSALLMTSWSSPGVLCCRSCKVRNHLFSTVYCAALGWWGFPWGMLVTPIQIGRNVFGLFSSPAAGNPSPALRQIVLASLAPFARQLAEQGELGAEDFEGEEHEGRREDYR